MHFLLVLMCPIWPQFAHFRCVPAFLGAGATAGEVGESTESAAPSVCSPFCLSRAIRRSLLRSRRASSFSSLKSCQSHQPLVPGAHLTSADCVDPALHPR